MLIELKVSHFATIDNTSIQFGKGLNILSGETGAGKSVLLKSLALLMGSKSSADVIRTGHDQALVEGSFDLSQRPDILERLSEMGIEAEENQLIVRRMVHREGKSRVYINGALSPLNALQDLVAPLIEVTGSPAPLIEITTQHENRTLLSKAYHLVLLDRFAGIYQNRLKFTNLFNEKQKLKERLSEIEANERTRVQRLDFLVYQRDEIKSLELKTDEEDNLEQNYLRLKNSHQLVNWAQLAETALYADDESALVRLHRVLQKAQDILDLDPSLAGKIEPLRQAKTLLEDFVYEVRAYGSNVESTPEHLEEIEKRRSDLRTIMKKHGGSVEEILLALNNIEEEIHQLQNTDETKSEILKTLKTIDLELSKIGNELHATRTKALDKLIKKVNIELQELNMKGVRFHSKIEKLAEAISSGFSDIEFCIQNGPKDEPRSLAKSASGGELSRILLALKDSVGSADVPRTYLFDEVDTGVSGPTAEKVGKKLHQIAKGQQVICVTHLPQVASQGDVHFVIQKTSTSKGVRTDVLPLTEKDRVKEIARLISGEKITKTSLAHAEQLLGH